ncbi:hypothetical protein HOS18_gp41 [Aeromonas phage CF7]|uniref:Uncharacterized protein n=1 Tax=Aeromonas phage CF7 TaxID=2507411 RepID=A0A249XLA3_9CAUD|nr:hypothetical protein HOS18_gp41 [Aeromonas phage CF7]ASZ71987.1 hypothetical protein CF7_41 [Aeromonas phage CF7]
MSVKQLAKKVLERLASYETAKSNVKDKEAALLVKEAQLLDKKAFALRAEANILRGEVLELRGSAYTISQLAEKLK